MTVTDTTPRPLDIRDLTDDELARMYDADALSQAAAVREAGRRDREDRLARTRAKAAAVYAEGERQAYAQYLEASGSDECKGRMLSRAGMAAHDRGEFTSEFALWRMPEGKAREYASEELNLWWKYTAPRVTPREYVRQQAAARRGEYQQARDEREANHERATAGTGLDRDETGALRREPAAPQAPQARPGRTLDRSRPGRPALGEPEAGSEERTAGQRATRPVQRDGMNAVAVPATTAPARPAGTVACSEPRIPGDQLLDLLRDQWFGMFARLPSPAALDAVTLWAAHCWMRDENGVLVFRATPRLGLFSSEPGSGKGRVLELLMHVLPCCFGLDLEPTKAGLIHTINKEHATVLLDEGDLLFAQGQRHSDVRAVINGGTYRHGTVLNGKGAKANREPVFGPLALAGLDVMETATGDKLTALFTRFVKIRMEKASGENRPPKLTRKAEEAAENAKTWLERWAAQVRGEVADAEPEIPDGVEGRAEDIWTPLLAVAQAAGGEWPARAHAACRELALAEPQGGEDLEDEFAAFAESFGTFQ